MGQKYLLDTNAIIDFAAGKLPIGAHRKLSEIIDDTPKISVITKIELLSFSSVPPEIVTFSDTAIELPLTEEVALETINIRKEYKLKLPDAIIAATAIVSDLILITRNVSDFKKVSKLSVIDPHIMG